jgi:hypothetical protein
MEDLLLVGRIHTLDPARPEAGAVLVRGGRFACVGDPAECLRLAGPGTRRIDLGAGSAVPGLADAHGHVLGLGRSLEELSCTGVGSEEVCARRAADRSRRLSAGEWLLGRGWDQNLWPGARFPTERTLSEAVPDRPAILERVDGHAAWVNARALAAAGISRGTADPPGGAILRHADGTPTGVLVDAAADLVRARVPRPGPEEIERLLTAALRELLGAGLTSVHDAGAGADVLEAYRRLALEDRLPLRVYAMIDGQVPRRDLVRQMAVWSATPEIGRLTVRAVKLYADGALGSRGAALSEPYADAPSTTGLLLTPPDELRERIRIVARAGFQPAVHAIGDRACAAVLADFAALGPDLALAVRPRVEHLQILLPRDVPLLASAYAVASMQPTHATSDAPWAVRRLGAGTARLSGAYAWRRILDQGVPLAFGSDFPVESFDPRLGLYAAETRLPAGASEPFLPEQRLSRLEALRAFTFGAAFAERAEGRRGTIRVGLDADLTAFAGDVLDVPASELRGLPVSSVVVGGRVELER